MGRKRWSTRLVVEDCHVTLSVTWLTRLARLFNRPPGAVWLTLLDSLTGDPLARIECQRTFCEPHGLAVLIRVEGAEGTVLCNRQAIPVVITHPHFGGRRHWFRCGECGRRVGRLYLPESADGFQCRHCANLTHRSARQHNAVIYSMAKDVEAINRALVSESLSKRLRGVGAFALRMRWEAGHSKRQMAKVLR